MGMEERRKRLMASDSQPTRVDRQTTHVAGTREIFDTLCNCVAESTTVKPVGLLNHIVNVPLPSDTHRRLSTRGWTLKELLEQSERFKQVKRFSLKSAKKTIINFDETGVPCIIYDLHRNPNWPKHYTASWLKKHGPKEISVRNVYNSTDRNMLLDEFIEQSRRTAPTFASLKEKERLYGGDVKCPEQWEQQIRNVELVPSFLLPGNEEDLLPPQHVDTFKCHIGIADTFSSFHLDLCASSGHNLMCHTEGEGSSFWFMTEGKDASQASQYFENWKRKGQDHVLTVEHLAKAPFTIYVAEQKLGDLVLIPPQSSNSLHEEYRGSFLQNYKKGQDHLIQTQQFGCKPDPTQQRVRLAEQYRRCRPVNPNFVQAGWYDVDVEVLASKTEIEQDLTNVSQSLPLESGSRSSSPSASFDSPLSSLSELSELDVNDVVKSTLKRKRQVLDFVFVPNQPYKRRVLQKPTSIAATPDSSDLRGVVSCVQYISSSPTPSLDAVEVSHEERSQDRQAMQGQSPDPPGSPEIVTRDKSSSQSSASGAMTSSLNSETSTLPAAKKSRTARRVIEEPDIPSPPTPPRSRSTSSTTTESSQTQQSSQLQEAPVRTVQHSSSLPPTTDTEPRRMLTDRIITKRRKRKLSLNESSSKRAEVSRRQTNSSTPTVDDLAEALNTAAFHNHSASYDVDVDHFSNPTTSHDVSKEVGIPASTSATKVPSARTGLSRSSPAASGMVRERDQGNIQIDPRLSPSIGRHSHRNPVQSPSLRSTPSLSETDVRHSTSINVEKNATATAEHPPVKRRVHSTLPAPTLSLPTPSSSKSSVLPTRQHQTKVVAPAQKGETFRGGPRQLPPRGPISCDRATPEASSHDPLPAMSGFTGLVSASSSIATGSQSVRDASDSQSAVPANVTPSKNNSVPDVAPPAIPVDGNPLEIAVQELQSAIHDSEHIPSRVVNAIVALADAMNKLAAQHNQNSQNLQNPHAIHPPWSQGNYPSMFQQPYTWPALWWGPDYQHFQQLLSQYREMFPYCTVPSFDEDGSRMRSGYSYGQRRFQPYREDFERRPDNRNHPFTRPRYNAAQDQDRPSRPMWSENARHRAYPSNPGSHRRTFSGEGRIWDRNSRQSEPVNLVGSAEAGSAGAGSASSPSSSLHNTGGSSDKSNNADNLMDRADPHQDHSLCRSPSSITNQSQSSCPLDTLSQAPVQQSGQAGSVPPSPHPAPSADLLPGKGRSITELDCRTVTNKEGGREQKETAMDDDLSQKEHPASQSINLQNSLY
ncbi:hypothetical protein C0992_000482, partial [Termitomyces sp. T32_za158]